MNLESGVGGLPTLPLTHLLTLREERGTPDPQVVSSVKWAMKVITDGS